MAYYSERNGLRKTKSTPKTYDISEDKYGMLLKCCDKYKENLSWLFPEDCPDGRGCCGLNNSAFNVALKYEIPDLFRNKDGDISVPGITYNVFSGNYKDEYDQYALLDYIEYFASNCRDVKKGDFHSFFGHYHLTLLESDRVYESFQKDINRIFDLTGLLYHLNDSKEVERVVENDVVDAELENRIKAIKEDGLKELLQEAVYLHRKAGPTCARDSVEKLWDAFERLKTYYTSLNKSDSANKLINDMADGDINYIELFKTEFSSLTKVGNNYRIRHHETNKIDINRDEYYDYLFNRCMALISLAVNHLT